MTLRNYIDKTTDPIKKAYYAKLSQIESSNDPNAFPKDKDGNRIGTALGLFQFVEGTWNEQVKKMGKNYTLEDRTDPTKSREVAEYFTEGNRKYLTRQLGREPNEAELYLAHFSGMGRAKQAIKAYEQNPNASASEVYTANEINSNPRVLKGKTIRDVYRWANKKMGVKNPINRNGNRDEKKSEELTPEYLSEKEQGVKAIDKTRVDVSKFLKFDSLPTTKTPDYFPKAALEEKERTENTQERSTEIQRKQQEFSQVAQATQVPDVNTLRQQVPSQSLYNQLQIQTLDFSNIPQLTTPDVFEEDNT